MPREHAGVLDRVDAGRVRPAARPGEVRPARPPRRGAGRRPRPARRARARCRHRHLDRRAWCARCLAPGSPPPT
nr:hypothetical protein [Angustibacter aerolatus]